MSTKVPPQQNPASPYKPLSHIRKETRLVQISKSRYPGSKIHCELVQVSLPDDPQYCALSYCWGERRRTQEIIVNGTKHLVTASLYDALLEMRRRGVRKLWVDALSINQEDDEEKAQQVEMMDDIFADAQNVFLWLGQHENNSKLAMKTLKAYNNVDASILPNKKLAQQQRWLLDRAGSRQAVQCLMERPYWRRVWIIQEVSKAARAEVVVDKLSMPFKPFLDAVFAVHENAERNILSRDVHDLLTGLRDFHRQEQHSDVPQMSLIHALLRSRHALASDARDKLYALRHLAHDSKSIVRHIDYHSDRMTVFQKATGRIITEQGRTAVMLLARGRQARRSSNPSSRASSPSSRPGSIRLPGDSNSNAVSSWTVAWDEIGEKYPSWILDILRKEGGASHSGFDYPHLVDDGRLKVLGVVLDTVKAITGLVSDSRMSRDYGTGVTSMPGFHLRQESKGVMEDLWDVLSFYKPPPKHSCSVTDCIASKWQPLFAMAFLMLTKDDGRPDFHLNDFNNDDLLQKWFSRNGRLPVGGRTIEELLADWHGPLRSKVQHGICDFALEAKILDEGIRELELNHMRVVITEKGRMQLAYREAAIGDRICRLQGCPLPVLLRPCHGLHLGSKIYEFVGEVYMPGYEEEESWTQKCTGWTARDFAKKEWKILTIR